MESSGQRPPDPEVPLGDVAIATEIANAAARGRGADRAPTLEQLLAGFGEPEPTDAARRRVAAALRMVGMGVRPDLMRAEPGQRLMLLPPGAGSRRSRGRALAGLLGVAGVLLAAAAGAKLLEGNGTADRAADSLPSETSTFPAKAAASDATPARTETATQTASAPATTDTTATETTGTETTATTPGDGAAAAAERRRKLAAARQRRAAAAAKTVTVRVDASARPTFLCVEDGTGKTLFSGMLSGKQVFTAARVRMNIGLASTRVTVNGSDVRLDGSPAGLDVTRKGGARALGLGQRPCG